MFAHSYRPKWWQFWKRHFYLTPNEVEWITVPEYAQEPTPEEVLRAYPQLLHKSLTDEGVIVETRDLLSDFKYYVVVSCGKYSNKIMGFNPHKAQYYSFDREYYNEKFHRRMSKPVFASDINKAEFIKSRKYADEVATRCRQTGSEMVAVREVYVYRENELLKRNIVVVLRHKENEKMKPQFIRTYDKADGGFNKTSRYDQALHFTYDEYLGLYEQLHALHKEYIVLPKIVLDGEKIVAKDVDGRDKVEMTLRLKDEESANNR